MLFLFLTTCLSTQHTSKQELHCVIIITTTITIIISAVVMSVANCFSNPISHVAVALYCVFNICIVVFLV